jgi:3D-(3,5/4)-trihydroxycyclohexane-1,2-dione acylhydrolase (decyclizing)
MVPHGDEALDAAVALIAKHERIAIKAGGGTRGADDAVRQLAERIGAAVVLSPGSTGVLPDNHPQNMHVGGSKGSISGNYAMENASLLVAIGTRGVCQADCSGVGYPAAEAVININGDLADLMHYANTVGLPGDVSAVIALAGARGSIERDQFGGQGCMAGRVCGKETRMARLQAGTFRDTAAAR